MQHWEPEEATVTEVVAFLSKYVFKFHFTVDIVMWFYVWHSSEDDCLWQSWAPLLFPVSPMLMRQDLRQVSKPVKDKKNPKKLPAGSTGP